MAIRYDEATGRYENVAPTAGMPAPQEDSGFLHRTVGDAATSLAKGVAVQIPQAALGIANFATAGLLEKPLGAVGDAVEGLGKWMDKGYSTQHQQQAQEVADTKGFLPTIGAMVSRPGYLADTALEQIPAMFAGGAAGKAMAGGKALLGAALGEGAVAGGQAVEQIRQEAGGETTFGQRALGAASGAVTGAIGYGAGKLANKMGITDMDVLLAGGGKADDIVGKIGTEGFKRGPGLANRVGRGVLSEGVLEELPQSAQEQMLQNVALDRPITQGVAEASAQGLVLGGAMGGTVAGMFHNNRLADGVAAIQFLSQPPQLDENGNIADQKTYDQALRALTALHPPGSVEDSKMGEWRLEQMARLARGEGVDWTQFNGISTNEQLTNLASNYAAGVEARRVAAEQAQQIQTAVANGQLPANITDDMGNEVPRAAAPVAPTKQEIARAAEIQKLVEANDMEGLARRFGQIVRPTPEAATPAPATAPAAAAPPTAPTPPAAPPKVRNTKYHSLTDAELATRIQNAQDRVDKLTEGDADWKSANADLAVAHKEANIRFEAANAGPQRVNSQSVWEAIKASPGGKFVKAESINAVIRMFNSGDTAGAIAQAASMVEAAKGDPKLTAAYTALHDTLNGASNVETPPVSTGAAAGADPKNTTPIPKPDTQKRTEGDAASKSAEKTPEAKVTTPPTGVADETPVPTQGQESSTVPPVEGSPAVEGQKVVPAATGKGRNAGTKGKSVRQEVATKESSNGQETKTEVLNEGAAPAAPRETKAQSKAREDAKEFSTATPTADLVKAATTAQRTAANMAAEKDALARATKVRDRKHTPEDVKGSLNAFITSTEANIAALQQRADEHIAAAKKAAHAKSLEQDKSRTADGYNVAHREGIKATVKRIMGVKVSEKGHKPNFTELETSVPLERQAEVVKLVKQLAKKSADKITNFRDAATYIYNNPNLTSELGNTNPTLQVVLEESPKATSLLDAILKLTKNPEQLALAKHLQSLGVDGVNIVYSPMLVESTDPNTKGWKRGNYSASTNTVTIYAGGENTHVILHELTHALTVQRLDQASKLAKAGSQTEAQLAKAYRDLTELFNYLNELPGFKGEYAFKSLAEFVAEAQSNPALQAKLKATQVPTGLFGKAGAQFKSLWDAGVSFLRNLLGMKPGTENALEAALRITDEFFEGNTKDKQPKATAGEYANIGTPLQAVTAPFQAAKQYLNRVDSPTKGMWSSFSIAARKVWLQAKSLNYIAQAVNNDPALKPLREHFQSWFKNDAMKTEIKTLIKDEVYDGFLRDVEIALAKTKDPQKVRNQMGWLASEASILGIDLTLNFDDNAKKHKLDPKFKTHANRLHDEYKALAREYPGLATQLLKGEKVMRKMHTMQTATTMVSALTDLSRKSDIVAVNAKQLLDKYAAKLDILQDSKGLANADPTLHLDGLAAELHKNIEALIAEKSNYFGTLNEVLERFGSTYSKGYTQPYMHLARHGNYSIKFDVKTPDAQTAARLEKILAPYGIGIGQFHGNQRNVRMRFDDYAEMEAVKAVLLQNKDLIANRMKEDDTGKKVDSGELSLAAGTLSETSVIESAYGLDRVMRGIRSRMAEKLDEHALAAGAAGKADLKAAFSTASNAINEVILDMMDADSARQATRMRHKVPGYSTDYLRSFAKRTQWYDAAISNMATADKFGEVFTNMQKAINEMAYKNSDTAVRGQELHDELAMRFSNSLKVNDNKFVTGLSVFGNHFYLALSPAYLVTNMLQPYMLSLPTLGGRHGFVASAKAMARASADAAKILSAAAKTGLAEGGVRGLLDARVRLEGLGLAQDEIDFLYKLIRTGVVDATQGHELGRMAEGTTTRAANAAKALSLLNHYSEVGNRLSVGLAAYRLSKSAKNGIADPEARLDYVKQVISNTQFNYTDHNTARLIGRHGFMGAATPLFMQFQRFAFFTMENYIRLVHEGFINKEVPKEEREYARKALYGTLGATSLFAGTMGLPFASVLAALANGVGGDDKDIREQYREWLASVFGKDLGEMIARGAIPRSLGVDLSGAVGHQDLLPGSRFVADRRNFEDKIKSQSSTMMGPAFNAGFDIIGGSLKIADGDLFEGFKAMLPRFAKGYANAYQTTAAGGFVNKQGDPVPIPATWGDIAMQAGGFTPNQKAEQSEQNFYYQGELNQTKQDLKKLRKEVVGAVEKGEMTPELQQQWMEYNATHPEAPLKDVTGILAARARARAMAEMTGSGVLESNRKHLPKLSAYNAAYNLETD